MNEREQRGLIIAATCKLSRKKHYWLVPSQSKHEKTYRVDPVKNTCTCEDHQETGEKCKHIYAVEITRQREFEFMRVYEVSDTLPLKKPKTYRQDWSAYNAAQAGEKHRVQELLLDLCRDLPDKERPRNKTGWKPHRVRDCVFAMAFKVYCGLSSRRFSCDLADAFEKGYTTKVIPGAKVTKFFEDPHFTPILKALIVESAAPLRSVETDFAIDSSGFGSTRYE